jgi:hypothetical protein
MHVIQWPAAHSCRHARDCSGLGPRLKRTAAAVQQRLTDCNGGRARCISDDRHTAERVRVQCLCRCAVVAAAGCVATTVRARATAAAVVQATAQVRRQRRPWRQRGEG